MLALISRRMDEFINNLVTQTRTFYVDEVQLTYQIL